MGQGISRRGFLKNTTLIAGASAVSFNALFGFSRAFAQDMTGTDDDLQTVINLAATAELLASTHYLAATNAANNGDLDLAEVQVNYLKTAFLAEREHYDLLLSLGAQPVVQDFYVPETLFSDVDLFSQITEVAETAFTAAYLAAARIFTNLGQPATPFRLIRESSTTRMVASAWAGLGGLSGVVAMFFSVCLGWGFLIRRMDYGFAPIGLEAR